MNQFNKNPHTEIREHQLRQFQNIIAKLFQCCQERMQYQSEKFELPEAEMRCLMLFGEARYLTPKRIAEKMNVVKSRVSKIMQGLIQKSLIQRIKDPGDSRIKLLSLTAYGQKKYNEIRKDKTYLESVLAKGAESAHYRARKTLSKVYRKVGFIPRKSN